MKQQGKKNAYIAATFVPKRCKTATYQRSFFVRSCRIWNTLPEQLRDKNVALNSYKRSLLNYYLNTLYNIYIQEDPRTWKSICLKCNSARRLLGCLIVYIFPFMLYLAKLS